MALTSSQILQRIKDRTHYTSDDRILGEIKSAQDWAFNRLYNSENGPDTVMTAATELTLASRTREYDLGAQLTGTLYGIKQLWLRFTSETVFSPMRPVDSDDLRFIFNDQWTSTDTTVATGHPVMYDSENFSKVRFSPPLPANSVLRVDFWRKPPNIDPAANNTLAYGDDLPEPLYEAIADKTTAQVFVNLDDDRSNYWDQQAEFKLRQALYAINKRNQGPVITQPFRIRRKRWI